MSGDSEERMRQRRFMRGALGRELQTLGGTSFLLRLLSSSSLPLLLASSPASFSLISHQGKIFEGTTSDFFPRGRTISIGEWSNLSKYISSAPNGTITKVLHHKCFCNGKCFKPSWSFSFLGENISTKHNIMHINRSKHDFKMHLLAVTKRQKWKKWQKWQKWQKWKKWHKWHKWHKWQNDKNDKNGKYQVWTGPWPHSDSFKGKRVEDVLVSNSLLLFGEIKHKV